MTHALSSIDFRTAVIAVDRLLIAEHELCGRLDRLYTERFYLLTQQTRSAYESGSINETQLKQAWPALDLEMDKYDRKLCRRLELEKYLQDLAVRLRYAAQVKLSGGGR